MTHFNPKIYNKENLKDEDRAGLEYWNTVFTNVIETAEDGYGDNFSPSPLFNQIISDFVSDFCKELKFHLGLAMQENVVTCIDNYENDVAEREEYTTFEYDEGEDENE